jgi:hypothetical protein
MIRSALLGVLNKQCTAWVSCDRMIMECTREECTCNRRAGTAAREYALRYPGPRHRDANVFRQLEHLLCETGSVMQVAHGLYVDRRSMSHA